MDFSGHLRLHDKAACQHSTSQTDRQQEQAQSPADAPLPWQWQHQQQGRAPLRRGWGGLRSSTVLEACEPPTAVVLWLQ